MTEEELLDEVIDQAVDRALELMGVCRQNLSDKLAIDLREDLVHLS